MSVTATPPNPLQLDASNSKTHGDHDALLPPQLPQGYLELCIPTHYVGLYPQPPAHITTNELAESPMTTTAPSQNIGLAHPDGQCGLLIGRLVDFQLFSNEENSQWLIDIAHDICDPAQKRGRLVVWHNHGWRDVGPTRPLIASTYHYLVPPGVTVSLTKISARIGRSQTDATGYASTMANHVKSRDGQRCWVTRRRPHLNSHICPKRMGDHLLHVVYNTFVQTPPPPTLSIFDEMCGIPLLLPLDHFFDKYEFGLRRFVALDEYVCHFFPPDDWPPGDRLTQFGFTALPEDTLSDIPSLHGTRITPPPLPDGHSHPPPGLFRWH